MPYSVIELVEESEDIKQKTNYTYIPIIQKILCSHFHFSNIIFGIGWLFPGLFSYSLMTLETDAPSCILLGLPLGFVAELGHSVQYVLRTRFFCDRHHPK